MLNQITQINANAINGLLMEKYQTVFFRIRVATKVNQKDLK